ncbi:AI-2E family transporter [Roseivivax sp. THAF30]|uniref:AI-2E family transporter n=1 Tax=Roseivivax sp. THAF30 TaxID=2587852 RepID=UPI0012A97B48|nr:AI-2E family transporter [Roseivivax sp. THAF30]QFT62764.1 AI-2 transport protein TqsA [Roseivivax sp. THAF30]
MRQKTDGASAALIIIASLLVAGALYVAQDVAAPIALAIVFGIIVAPIMEFLCRIGLPPGLGGALILLLTVALLSTAAVGLEPVFWRFVDAIPSIRMEMQEIVWQFRDTLNSLGNVNEEMKEAFGGAGEDGGDGEAAAVPSMTDAIFAAPAFLAQFLIFAGTFYFFLVHRLSVYSFLAARLSRAGEGQALRERFRVAEFLVSRYFIAITIVNFTLGFATTAVMTALGMPLPYVWGFAVAILNYVLYLGPALMAFLFLIGGLVNFEGLMSAAPAAAFLTLNMIEAQFVTPAMVGRHVRLNPLLVFVSLVFGLWFWGPIGGVVAIPCLVIGIAMVDERVLGQHARKNDRSDAGGTRDTGA